jgi:hypothetical protein
MHRIVRQPSNRRESHDGVLWAIGKDLFRQLDAVRSPSKIEDRCLNWFIDNYLGNANAGINRDLTNGPGDGGVDASVHIPAEQFAENAITFILHFTNAIAVRDGKRPTPLGKQQYFEFSSLANATIIVSRLHSLHR